MMPSAKIVRRRNMPPLNRSRKPNSVPWFCWTHSSKRSVLIPGIGICAPMRYTASRPSANRRRLRRSGTRKTLATASKNFMELLLRADHFRRPAGCLDFFKRRFRKLVRLHTDLPFQIAAAQNFQAVLQLADHAALEQRTGVERLAVKRLQPAHVHNRIFLAENVVKAAFWQAAMQGHLAAFEPAHVRVAGDRFRALRAASGILSATGAHALADALLLVLLPAGRFQLAQVHDESTPRSRAGAESSDRKSTRL